MRKTVTFPPLHTSFFDQLNKGINEEPDIQAAQRAKKIKFTADHIDQVTHINGRRVYHPLVDGENIYFFLTNYGPLLGEVDLFRPENRTHYYPIQYAEIIFENKG